MKTTWHTAKALALLSFVALDLSLASRKFGVLLHRLGAVLIPPAQDSSDISRNTFLHLYYVLGTGGRMENEPGESCCPHVCALEKLQVPH